MAHAQMGGCTSSSSSEAEFRQTRKKPMETQQTELPAEGNISLNERLLERLHARVERAGPE